MFVGIFNLIQLITFGSCMTGPGEIPQVAWCADGFDYDDDGDVDLRDFAYLMTLTDWCPCE